jgi:hypothetical protein
MIESNDSYNPKNYDILLTNIGTKDIHESIPRKLNVKYLSDFPNELDGDITRIMYGFHLHLFCTTTVRKKDKIKMVIFLIDTGSSITFISEEVLYSFGITVADPE